MEEPRIERLRRLIEEHYAEEPLGSGGKGGTFGEILCNEMHHNDLHFTSLAEKWGVSLATLGKLICDHCERLERDPFDESR